jgi:hypothetical protein
MHLHAIPQVQACDPTTTFTTFLIFFWLRREESEPEMHVTSLRLTALSVYPLQFPAGFFSPPSSLLVLRSSRHLDLMSLLHAVYYFAIFPHGTCLQDVYMYLFLYTTNIYTLLVNDLAWTIHSSNASSTSQRFTYVKDFISFIQKQRHVIIDGIAAA